MESNLLLCWAVVVSSVGGSKVTEDVIMLLSSVYMKYVLHLIKGSMTVFICQGLEQKEAFALMS